MVNYQFGKIYKISTPHSSNIYIGSTSYKLLSQRMAKHTSGYRCYIKGKGRYYTSYDLIQLGECNPLLIETYPCNSKDELEAREGYWLHKLRTDGVHCVNKLTPGAILGCGGIKEYHIKYYQENKEVLKIQGAKYKQAHKKYRKNYDYWCKTSPIGILSRAYFHKLNKHNEN